MGKKHTVHTKEALGRRDADVVKKVSGSTTPNEHYEIKVGSSVFAEGYGNDPAGAFLARPGKLRAQPHQKINECDH